MKQQEFIGYALPVADQPVTIGAMVVQDYRRAEVFRSFGLDYCCGGKKTLDAACTQKGINPDEVRLALEALDKRSGEDREDVGDWRPDALANHIVDTHHRYVEAALPMLYELTGKVARVHGERHPELVTIAERFDVLAHELVAHMRKEEMVLFPFIGQMVAAQNAQQPMMRPFFGAVVNPVRMMEAEHEVAGGEMEEIRRLSHDYTPPVDACNSYRVLFAKLEEFERDLHRHVHLENNVLFPKALELERATFAG